MHSYTIVVAVFTLLLVSAGALVTSNDAGLSVPDWPLSYGKLMPRMEGGVMYEHGHRMIATTVGLLTIILAVWLWRAEARRWLRWLGVAALLSVIIQGILGGMTVVYLLPAPISVSHATLAQLFFTATVAIALFTSSGWKRGPEPVDDAGWPSIHRLAIAAPHFALLQLILGAAHRHQAMSLVPHLVGAVVAAGVLVWASVLVLMRFAGHASLRRTASVVLAATFSQVFLGIFAYMGRIASIEAAKPVLAMVVFTVLHVAVGALTLAFSTLLAIQVRRHVRRARKELVPSGAPVIA